MLLRQQARTLAVASMLAFAITSVPAWKPAAHAADNGCTAATCGTHTCSYHGRTYGGGETIVATVYSNSGTRQRAFMCDGFTGKWVLVGREVSSSGSAAPEPGGIAPASETSPASPVGPPANRTAR